MRGKKTRIKQQRKTAVQGGINLSKKTSLRSLLLGESYPTQEKNPAVPEEYLLLNSVC